MKRLLLSSVAAVAISSTEFSADLSPINSKSETSLVPKSSLSLGLGGNLNLATFGQQNFYWAGVSNAYYDSTNM
ncbi:MAG: hypothetical protein ACKOPC_10945, partial [Methylocystis sp.]